MPDAAGDDVPELVQGDGVGAGVVEQHHRPVLDIVQPPLRGNKSEQSCWIKICYIAVTRMDKFIKFSLPIQDSWIWKGLAWCFCSL